MNAEFGRLIDSLELLGILKKTHIIVTSDHGEMFERGILEHITPTLFEPIARVPLVFHRPGQEKHEDVYTLTSAVDLLPTVNSFVGQSPPEWSDGKVLPTFTNQGVETERSVFVMDGKSNQKNGPFNKGTIAMVKDNYKLIYYLGYDGFDNEYEMYDLNNDPEELDNLYSESNTLSGDLRVELLAAVDEANKPNSAS